MKARGFTLVEVMVALAIVAIALPALMFSLSRQADDTAYLRDKSLARMVAQNKLAEKRLRVYAENRLVKAKESGLAEFAGREWYWWMETEETNEVPQFYKIEIAVALDEDHRDNPTFSLASYMQGDLVRSATGRGSSATGDDAGNDGDNAAAGSQSGTPTPVPRGERRATDAPRVN